MSRRVNRFIALAMMGWLLTASAVAAQPSQPDRAVLEELKAIRLLLERLVEQQARPAPAAPPAPADGVVTLPQVSGFALGRPDAPLTIVEFTDLQCPFCQRYHRTTFEEVVRQYVDTGKARYVSVDFPLTTIHPFAQRAARAARCAGEQEYFWEMRHEILINNAQLSDATFDAAARALKLDEAAFKACLADTTRFDEELRRDAALAATARVSGTPSFVIGRMSGRGLEGKLLVGAQPFDAFRIALEELLAGK